MSSSSPYFSKCFQTPKSRAQQDEELKSYQHHKLLISTLPSHLGWTQVPLRLYRNFWLPEVTLPGVLSLQKYFKPSPSDLLLATYPKSGTTWIKALVFATLDRPNHGPSFSDHPLLTRHPQDCSPYLEGIFSTGRIPDLNVLPSPRTLGTHIPYSLLPDSVRDSDDCRIVYVCRDPKDTLVSMWHFGESMRPEWEAPLPFDKAFEQFCRGDSPYGPVWDHQLAYWKESVRRPEKVLYLKYEDMKEKPEEMVRRLAEFVGQPFSEEEERKGVVGEIVRMCSIENLKGLDVNKVGMRGKELDWAIKNSSFFRKGKVGDWKEHLTQEMAERLDRITQEKTECLKLINMPVEG